MRVFLDANVLFSASNEGSNIARLIALLGDRAEVVTSDVAREEARRNIALKRPVWSHAFERLMGRVKLVPTAVLPLPVLLDAKDAPLFAAAIRAGCCLFVTGDQRDFGHLYGRTVEGVTVLSLLGLAEILGTMDDPRR